MTRLSKPRRLALNVLSRLYRMLSSPANGVIVVDSRGRAWRV